MAGSSVERGRLWDYLQTEVRRRIVPLARVAALVPPGGISLELGCGQGLLVELLRTRTERVIGVDFDHRKCRLARARLGASAEIVEADLIDYVARAPERSFRSIVLSDTLSHLSDEQQDSLLAGCARLLDPRGALVLKVIDTDPPWKTQLSEQLSKVVYGLRASLSEGQRFHYRPASHYRQLLEKVGFAPTIHRLDRFHPIPHVAIVARA
jgi:cyclopropane fatty-acyl-phospholipid synthase-like methyltransferase